MLHESCIGGLYIKSSSYIVSQCIYDHCCVCAKKSSLSFPPATGIVSPQLTSASTTSASIGTGISSS